MSNKSRMETLDETSIKHKKVVCLYKDLIPAKTYYLVQHYSFGNFIPYVNLYLVSIGLSISQAGLVNGIRSIFASMISLFIGALADYTQKPKAIVIVTLILCVLVTTPTPYILHTFLEENKGYNQTCQNYLSTRINGTKDLCNTVKYSNHPPISFMIFWLSLVGGTGLSSMPLAERAVVALLKRFEGKASYGMQRIFAPIGYSLGSFLTGLIIDNYEPQFGMSRYTVLFFPLAVSNTSVLISIIFLNMETSSKDHNKTGKSKKSMKKTLLKTLKKFNVIIFLFTVLKIGICFGLMNSYLLLLLQDIETSKTKLGLTIAVSTISEILIFPFSARLMDLFGGPFVCFCIAVFSYAVRFLAYFAAKTLWIVMASQILHALSNSMFWVAVNEYTYTVAPLNISQTMFSIISVLFYMVGSVIANVVGGWLFQVFGGRYLFLIFAVTCFAWSVLLSLYVFISRWRYETKTTNGEKDKQENNFLMKNINNEK